MFERSGTALTFRINWCPLCHARVEHMDFSDGWLRQFCSRWSCDFEENFNRAGEFRPTISQTPRVFA